MTEIELEAMFGSRRVDDEMELKKERAVRLVRAFLCSRAFEEIRLKRIFDFDAKVCSGTWQFSKRTKKHSCFIDIMDLFLGFTSSISKLN